MNSGSAPPDEIARLAFQIYQEEGCPEGCADDHWARAERALREQRLPIPEKSSEDAAAPLSPPE